MHSHQHDSDTDWAARAADITREGEVVLPYMTEAASWLAEFCRREGVQARRILDIGSGPGVGTCVLAQQFESAVVVAVDGSREMLEWAAARAQTLGLSARVQTHCAELPTGLGGLGRADLAWAAMVLHHVEDLAATFNALHSLLEPAGVLAIAEFGDPPRFLPDDIGVGRPGLGDRLATVNASDAFPSVDFPAVLKATGFDLVADRMVRVHLDAPLSDDARRVAHGYLEWAIRLLGDRLDPRDREAVDTLLDERAPLGIMRRQDVFLDISRRLYVARVRETA